MVLAPYLSLLESFLGGTLLVEEFERRFIDMYKNDPTMWDEGTFEVLDTLFTDVDAFCADPSLREAEDLDEKQLRAAASTALDALAKS